MPTQFQTQSVKNFLRGRKDITPLESLPISMPQSTVAVAEPGSGFLGLLKTIGQEVARNIGSAGVTIARAIKGETIRQTEEPTQFRVEDAPPIMQGILKSIFRDEPIKSIEQRIVEAEPKVKIWGETLTKSTNPIFSRIGSISANNPSAIAFAGIMGSVGIDLTPFGGSSKNVFKAMVKTKTAEEAVSLLGKMGVADDLARTFTDDVVKVAKEADAKKLFNSIATAQRMTKVARPVEDLIRRKQALETLRAGSPGDERIVSAIKRLDAEIEQARTLRPVAEAVPEIVPMIASDSQINKYLSNAYKVYSGQKPYRVVAQITEDVAKRTDLPKDIVVNRAFFEKMIVSHPEIPKDQLFRFVKTLNLPDEIYKFSGQERLNFLRAIEDGFTEFAGTLKKGEGLDAQQIVTFFKTNKDRYLNEKIRNTAEAVFLKTTGRAPSAPSAKALPSPPAGGLPKGISGVSRIDSSIAEAGDVSREAQRVGGIGEIPPIKPPIPPIVSVAPLEEARNTIQKLIKAIDDAVPLRAEQKKLYQEELAKRTARVAQAGAKVEGEAGFFAQLGALKGELPKKSFEAIRGQFNQKEIDSLFNAIEQTKTLLPLEKVGTKEGLRKLFEGVVPTPSEIEKLREVFPKELIDSVLARRPLLQKITNVIGELLNVPRTLMATLDLSAPFRQGIFMLGRPIRFAKAFKDMFKFAVSEKAYEGLIEGIKARPTYLKMKQGGLAITEIGGPLLKREERFMSQLAERIPGYGALVRGSNRAYTGFLNKLRVDIFDDILTKAKIAGRDLDNSLLGSIADFINAGTGRGKFGLAETGILPKSMEKAAVVMNAAFFSPRLMASRLNLLNPYFYIQLDPLVRKEAIKTLFATSGILGSVYGLWKLNGRDVGLDPRSADFGKIKIGNTRYDPLGGFQQYVKLAAQLITGEIISSTTGRTITLGEGFKPLTRKEIILRFFENKTSPIASFVIGLMTGQTAVGEDVDIPTEVVNRFIPMVVQDLYDISQEEGAEGLLYGLPAIFGVGLQTYGKQELAEGISKIGEPTTQIRPVPELAEKIRELVLGQIPLGSSKSFSIETYFDQLQNLPREEAAEVFDKIKETNPELAKKLTGIVRERELGITVKDKDLKAKGVASGDRALAVEKEIDKLKTKEEKAALWDDYVKKGIITKDVAKQLDTLLNKKGDVSDNYERSIVGLVSDYARAFTKDPSNAFKALFTEEKLGMVKGNLVELQRFYGIKFDDKGGSEEYKRDLMKKQGIPLDEIGSWKLEHIVPVKAGGSSAESNLILVNNEIHNFFTPIDIAVGNAVKDGMITRKEAEELMRDFKVNKTITTEEVIFAIQ